MVDTRFHRFAGPESLGDLLTALNRPDLLEGMSNKDYVVTGASELDLAQAGEIAFAGHKNYAEALSASTAGIVIVTPALLEFVPATAIAIVFDKPQQLFVAILERLYPGNTRAILSEGRQDLPEPIIERDVHLGSNVVLGRGVQIGRGSVIGSNTVIGAGVTIGRNSTVGANVTIDCAHIGNEVVVHSGVRIGTEGFGWLDFGSANRKVPQLGRVLIQDRVEIGANSTIDRGALGDTMIGEGTKIDNLVQIGHNCRIGRHCLIAAMSGLSGSTILEDAVLMGGGTGTSGHLTIGQGTVVHGRAAVTKDWPAGSKIAGQPAQDIRDFWRELATMRKLSKGDKHG
jgi:UDP-3-O-[3-hydroxymyristoyl] glucosamine N-acyltransferase